MRILALVLLILASPLSAAPFLVCQIDATNKITVDLGDNTMRFNKSDWYYAEVHLTDTSFLAEHISSDAMMGIVYDHENNVFLWQVAVAGGIKKEGQAVCLFID